MASTLTITPPMWLYLENKIPQMLYLLKFVRALERGRKILLFQTIQIYVRVKYHVEDFFSTKIYNYTLHIQSTKCQSQELHRWYYGSGARLEPAIDRGFETRSGQTKDYELYYTNTLSWIFIVLTHALEQ
jgi:hypothetical protein